MLTRIWREVYDPARQQWVMLPGSERVTTDAPAPLRRGLRDPVGGPRERVLMPYVTKSRPLYTLAKVRRHREGRKRG